MWLRAISLSCCHILRIPSTRCCLMLAPTWPRFSYSSGGVIKRRGEERKEERREKRSHRSSCSIKVPLPHFKFTSLTQMEPLPTLMVGHEHGFLRGNITYQGLHSVRHRVKLYEEMIFYCMYLVSPSQAPL